VEEILSKAGEPAAQLAQQVSNALTSADFAQAAQANAQLSALNLDAPLQLYCAYVRVRLATYQGHKLEAFDVLEQIEQPYASLGSPGAWERQWYVLSWLTLPFACQYPIDIFYLHHQALALPQQVARLRCLARAVRYGVQFKDYPYMAFVLEHPSAQLPEGGDPYYMSIIHFLLAAHQRQLSELDGAKASLLRASNSPLQEFSTQQLFDQFAHLSEY
jgi:hypothetical protein